MLILKHALKYMKKVILFSKSLVSISRMNPRSSVQVIQGREFVKATQVDHFTMKKITFLLVLPASLPMYVPNSQVDFRLLQQRYEYLFRYSFPSNNCLTFYDSGLGSKKQFAAIMGSIIIRTSAIRFLRKSVKMEKRWLPLISKQW